MKEAMEKAAVFSPELAVLDVMLPDGSGFELFEKLKQMGDFPVLFLTACGEDEDKFRGLDWERMTTWSSPSCPGN